MTGVGLVSPLGTGVDKNWQALLAGRSGIGKLTRFVTDSVGLLDALGIAKAHVVGVSMGGAIAQEIAISFPDRLAP